MRASESNIAHATEEHEHTYPPQTDPVDSEPTGPRCSLRSILQIHRVFVVRRRYERGTSAFPPPSIRPPNEFGATTPSPARTRSETSTDSESRRGRKKGEKPAPKPDPPIIVPSLRYKVEPQTFVVRSELEFTTTCTVIHPVSRFQLKRPSIASFRKFRVRFRLPHRRQKSQEESTAKADKKRKRKSKGGVAIDQDVFDDALSLVQRRESHIEEPDFQSTPRRQSRQANQHERDSISAATKAARRSSGWAGVFSAAAIENNQTNSNSSTDHSSTSYEEGMSFEIDRRRNTLVVPDVDIGVAYTVKEELEEALGLVLCSDSSDSEDSWLDLN